MGKKIFIILVVALIGMLILPALASATLVNEYGMHYAGQTKCLDCHSKMSGDLKVTNALHGKFATAGINPASAGRLDDVPRRRQPDARRRAPTAPCGTPAAPTTSAFRWVTLGDSTGNSATEYLFFKGSSDPTVMPWNLVEGLIVGAQRRVDDRG